MERGRKKKLRNKGKCEKGLETMIMGIDHGYYAIKTRHFSFPAGVTVYAHKPYTLKTPFKSAASTMSAVRAGNRS